MIYAPSVFPLHKVFFFFEEKYAETPFDDLSVLGRINVLNKDNLR